MKSYLKKIVKNKTGRRIAIGDVHGCYFTLKRLLEEKIKIKENDQIFLLGDLIDKGINSRLVLDYVMELKSCDYEIYPIRGNHEEMILMAYNCGFEFFENYLEEYNSTDLLDGNPEDYLAFISTFDYILELNDFVLSHPGINEKRISPFTDLRGMFPQINFNLKEEELLLKRQVHGHVVQTVKEIENNLTQKSKRINIDSGCYLDNEDYGFLTGLDLDQMKLYFQRNIEMENSEEEL